MCELKSHTRTSLRCDNYSDFAVRSGRFKIAIFMKRSGMKSSLTLPQHVCDIPYQILADNGDGRLLADARTLEHCTQNGHNTGTFIMQSNQSIIEQSQLRVQLLIIVQRDFLD